MKDHWPTARLPQECILCTISKFSDFSSPVVKMLQVVSLGNQYFWSERTLLPQVSDGNIQKRQVKKEKIID